MDPDRIAAGARVAEQVVVAAASGDLDRVSSHVEPASFIDVRRAAGVDARVAVAVRLAGLDQAVVGGEGQESVLGVPAADHTVDDEAVRLEHVDGVEGRTLGGEVAEVDAVRAVGADHVQLLELGVEDHVAWRRAGAFDLEAFEAEDADEVLLVRAGPLLVVAEDLVSGLHRPGREVVARLRLALEARLLEVDAWEDQDRGRWGGDVIDGGLEVAVSALQAFRAQAAVVPPGRGRKGRDALLEVGVVSLADDEV